MTQLEILKLQKKVAKKMLAAIAMLLVATTMLVGVSYAWVSISSAPEASKISTTVGANGALEIALQSTDKATQRRAEIKSSRGDSNKSVVDSNLTWGNIVSLGENYGLESVALFPAALYVDDLYRIDLAHPVKAPQYGQDGRILSVDPVNKARYGENGFTYNTSGTGAYAGSDLGVNMMGFFYEGQKPDSVSVTAYDRKKIVDDMTEQMELLRSTIQNDIKKIMGDYSDKLYRWMYIALQINEPSNRQIDYTDEDKQGMLSLLDELEQITGKAYESLKYGMMAYAASDMLSYPDTPEGRRELGGLFSSYTSMTTSAIRTLSSSKNYTDIESAAASIDQMIGNIRAAKSNVDNVVLAIQFLIMYNKMSVDGIVPNPTNNTFDTVKSHLLYGKKNGAYDYTGSDPVENTMYLWKDSGVFSSLANIIGDYPAQFESDFEVVKIRKVFGREVRDTIIALHHIKSFVNVTSGASASEYEPRINTGVLGKISQTVASRKNNTTGTVDINQSSVSKISAFGYEVDLAFRCNDTGSLALQTAPVNRVTGEPTAPNENEELQGGGSNMTFELKGGIQAANARELIPQIYVVFASTQTGTVYGIATAGSVRVVGNTATADLILREPSFSSDGLLSPGTVRTNQAIIQSIQPNEIQYVSVLVYLNAATVDSSMMAYSSAVSLEGSINLQFLNGKQELVPFNKLNQQ